MTAGDIYRSNEAGREGGTLVKIEWVNEREVRATVIDAPDPSAYWQKGKSFTWSVASFEHHYDLAVAYSPEEPA